MSVRRCAAVGVVLLAVTLALPQLAGARGPSPAKRACTIYQKMGLVPGESVTVARDLRRGIGMARVKLMNGQVLHAKVDLRTNRLISDKILTTRANQLTALAAGRKGWPRGYVVESDPDGMVSSMTRRGNVRRWVVDYDRGAAGMALVTFNKAGQARRVQLRQLWGE